MKSAMESTAVDSENKLIENSYGNTQGAGQEFYNILKGGIMPINTTSNVAIEKVILNGINWFRGIMLIILVLEAYLVLKNKKNT